MHNPEGNGLVRKQMSIHLISEFSFDHNTSYIQEGINGFKKSLKLQCGKIPMA